MDCWTVVNFGLLGPLTITMLHIRWMTTLLTAVPLAPGLSCWIIYGIIYILIPYKQCEMWHFTLDYIDKHIARMT